MINFREIGSKDAELIAAMHTASWRTAYRGILNDEYLDSGIAEERRAEWERRLSTPQAKTLGVIARLEDEPVGFVFGFQNEHDCWGRSSTTFTSSRAGRGAASAVSSCPALPRP